MTLARARRSASDNRTESCAGAELTRRETHVVCDDICLMLFLFLYNSIFYHVVCDDILMSNTKVFLKNVSLEAIDKLHALFVSYCTCKRD